MILTVLVHLGEEIPIHLMDCVEQFRKFNSSDLIIIASNTEKVKTLLSDKDLKANVESSAIYENGCNEFNKLFPHSEGFWNVTTKRLFILNEFAKINKIESFFHCENDVLVYFNLNDFDFGSKMCLTDGSVDKIMLGFAQLTDEGLCCLCDFIIREIRQQDALKRHQFDFLSDMTLLKIYAKEYPNCVDYLPILPTDMNRFNDSLFDPASWGQFMGGTNNGHPPGFIDPSHIIGDALLKNTHWKVYFDNVPMLNDGNKVYKINNLHVHCKYLKQFMSK